MDKRPILNKSISIKDFKEFYWLKEELLKFCRKEGLKTGGSKLQLSERIESYLINGIENLNSPNTQQSISSKFNWSTEELLLTTVITDSYKNSENVRNFFLKEIGKRFKFNVSFMNWMKSNIGKTLEDAVDAWLVIENQKKNVTKPKIIAPQFEYNRYVRDFLADNPEAKRELAIKLWNIKKTMRGDNVYSETDLKLLNKNKGRTQT